SSDCSVVVLPSPMPPTSTSAIDIDRLILQAAEASLVDMADHHRTEEPLAVSTAVLSAALASRPQKRSRGHAVCEVIGCTRLSRKGDTNEKARFCTRHGGGRPCRYQGCHVAARGLLGFCYKHRHHGALCGGPSAADGRKGYGGDRSSTNSSCTSPQSSTQRHLDEMPLPLPSDGIPLRVAGSDGLGGCSSISLGTRPAGRPSAEYMAFLSDTSICNRVTSTNLDELFRLPPASWSSSVSEFQTHTPQPLLKF
ncbi:hypothetical protein FOZ60_017230, partial [Perkinsus olseni]